MNRFEEQPFTFDFSTLLLDKLKKQLKILDNSRDSELLGWLSLSFNLIEKYIWRVLSEREIIGYFSEGKISEITKNDLILEFRRAPINELVSLVFNKNFPLTASINIAREFGEISISDEMEPSDTDSFYPLVARVNCGYKIVSGIWQCPEPIQTAIIALAVYAYSNPMDCGNSGCNCSGSNKENGISLPSNISLMVAPYVLRRYDG